MVMLTLFIKTIGKDYSVAKVQMYYPVQLILAWAVVYQRHIKHCHDMSGIFRKISHR